MVSVWNEGEQRAWYPPEKLSPSQWTEKHRTLPSSVAAESGQLRLARTPYMYGILDCLSEAGVEEIVCLKSTQIGWSTAIESLVGYWVDSDPGPILLVLDSQKTAQECMDERIRPLVEQTPAVKQHLSPHAHDFTLTGIKFDTCPLYMGWAGSPGTLARRAIRYALFDEVDKYPSNAGKEADPVSLGTERTATYGYRRRVLIGSTPTVRTGTVWRAWESSGDKRRYHVPCPHCGQYQTLAFGQIKYPSLNIPDKNLYADTIEQQGLAHYECSSCQTPIKESHRPKMLAKGLWLSEGQTVDPSGKISGKRPRAKRVGFWINSLYSPWRTFSAIAAEHRRALNDPGRMQNFKNSWLAEPFEEIVKTASVEDYRKLTIDAPQSGIAPIWTQYLIVGVDVQKDRIYWVLQAWGAGYQSQVIAYGVCGSFDDLRKQTLEAQWTLERGGTSRAHLMCIDSGYRTDEVYDFAQKDQRVIAVKGDNDTQLMLVKESTEGASRGIKIYRLNTQLLKDRLQILRSESGRWLLNNAVDEVFLQHLASEHKTIIRGVARWEPKSDGAQNHYLDSCVYALAGAEIARVDLLKPQPVTAPPPQPQSAVPPAPSTPAPRENGEIKLLEESARQSKNGNTWLGINGNWLR
jgi:phage terminase large subunit GpA-like protein